jgi:hypothetical protein
MGDRTLQAELDALVARKLRILRENREVYVSAWLAETGLLPSESMLVQREHGDGRTTITVHRRDCPCSGGRDG